MSWNYRVIDHGSHLALHEVHYDDAGRVRAWSAAPVGFVANPAEGAAGLALSLEQALCNVRLQPVLVRADLPGG